MTDPETRDDGGRGPDEQKEAHRLGTINRWDAPDDEWTAEFDWTRSRGPAPYPVPGGWVLGGVEADGTGWHYYGAAGVDEWTDTELDPDDREAEAMLLIDVADEDASLREEPDMEWTLTVDGTDVFRCVEPDREDAYAAVARALRAYHDGELDDAEIVPSSGRKPDDVREQEAVERKQEENESLDRFVTDGGVDQGDGDIERGNHVALVSGGMDSAVAAHVAVRWGPADLLVYLDTGTGLNANREYIEEFADALGVQLWTLRTHESYEDRVETDGFPGPAEHGRMYRKLKERQVGRLATFSGGRGNQSDLHLWTGVRRQESKRRMANVTPEQEGPRWTWHAPIHDWSKEDCRQYVERFDLPRNELWDDLGRSGDCFCGCFGSPEEKIDLEAAGHGDHADWLRNLETSTDADGERGRWAWGALSDAELRAERVTDDQMTLCSTCGALPDGGFHD